MKDADIIQLYFERNEEAIFETKNKYGAYCYTIADNILYSKEDSEECVNDTFLHTWNAIPPERPARLNMFLAKITRNLAFDKFKAQTAGKRGGGKTEVILEELQECISGSDDVESQIIAKELCESINRFVHTLSQRDCNVFVRRYFFAEGIDIIAKRYALSTNNVMVILSRARKKLKTHLTKEGYLI